MFVLAFALAFEFVAVSLQATKLKVKAAIAVNSNSLVPISLPSFFFLLPCGNHQNNESPASPFAGDSVAEVFNSLANFPSDLAYFLLHSAFKPLLLPALFQVAVAG
jgi:hypothetical protein